MSLMNIAKKGWHPEKEGTTFKKQVTGLWRKEEAEDPKDHVSRPLSQLKDPASFGPPPRHVAAGGSPVVATSQNPPAYTSRVSPALPSRSQPSGTTPYAQAAPEPEEEEEREPVPYRVDTTGLSTSHLPPPPVRRDGADGRTPSPQAAMAARPGPPPSLPPRLPPRAPSNATSGSTSPVRSPAPEASRQGSYFNQAAVKNLGNAGISVPGLGIGKSSGQAPALPGRTPSSESTGSSSRFGGAATATHVNELQSRFSKLGTSSSPSAAPPSEGTSFAQKQAALQTASNFRKDPSSVSVADARSAASTMNNFRQRHGDQVAAGVKSANSLNQKYGLSDRLGSSVPGSATSPTHATSQDTSNSSTSPAAMLAAVKKKPAPPPPKKKPGLAAAAASGQGSDGGPPPVPVSTRPQF
ncbi:uncharacterized protein E0L32_011586 [Thyridium curvatum]|uniref:Uncharacterized protein n=1 Tax=Thyridium curvatum TaxID=1093900 RepID=A0A507BP27_9PEZI|nr:uncharacterized protein E0L32_011586 [Thyridium curvatum]TPX18548.1 hypothetical protein E0L32_011586 [Thyridium curvatum]